MNNLHQPPNLESTKMSNNKIRSLLQKHKFILGLGIFVIQFITIVCLLLRTPRYINIPINPPSTTVGNTWGWVTKTYSIMELPFFPPLKMYSPPLNGYYYIVRTDDSVSSDEMSLEEITKYFDGQLSNQGWVHSDSYARCRLFIPEVEIIPDTDLVFIHYRQEGYNPPVDYYEGNLVCLAVWSTEDKSTYQIIFVTVRPSWILYIAEIL
jgi:hypothetical protein